MSARRGTVAVFLSLEIDGVPHTARMDFTRGSRQTWEDPADPPTLEDLRITRDSDDLDVTDAQPDAFLERIEEAFHNDETHLQLDEEDLIDTSFTHPDT